MKPRELRTHVHIVILSSPYEKQEVACYERANSTTDIARNLARFRSETTEHPVEH